MGSPSNINKQTSEESESYTETINSGLPAILWADEPAEIEYLGKMKLDSSFYEILKIKGPNNFFSDLVYFDPDTGLMACTRLRHSDKAIFVCSELSKN